MIGLVVKDLLVLRKPAKLYLVMLAFYVALSVAGAFDNAMVVGFVCLFTLMLPISSFSYDELARWDKYAAALPVSRRGVVGSKYLLALILGCIAELLIVATALVLALLKNAAPGEVLLTGLACVGVGLLMNSILLPLLFQFGAEKGRLLTMAVLAVLFLLGFGGAKLLGADGLPTVPSYVEAVFPPVMAGAVSLVLYVSYRVSLIIYNKKEF